MKSFNIHRFYATFKWMELYNYKALVRFFSILAPILFVLAMLTTGGFWRSPSDIATSYEDDLYRLPAMLWSAWFIVFIIWASYITIDMKNTQARINTLMLPASNLEKFVVRWIHITILPCVLFFVAIVIVDALQAIYHAMEGYTPCSLVGVLGSVLKDGFLHSDCSWKTAGFLTLAWLWVHSVYVCLGCFFRRNSWIITSAILFVATTTLTFVASMLSLDFFNHNIHFHNGLYIGGELYVIDGYSIIATVVLLLTGFTVLNYWLAYKLFCRMQVINNKWFNV